MPSKTHISSPGEMGSGTFTQNAADALGLSLGEYLTLRHSERETGEKWCYGCRQTLPRTDFRNNRHQADGLRSECRACHQKQKNAAKKRKRALRVQGLLKTSAELAAEWASESQA